MRIATVLQALNGETLRQHGCLFGGGTAIVLSHGEYRESLDVDFLISDKVGFRELRLALTSKEQMSSITRNGSKLTLARDIRADQYGIRTMLSVGGVEIKFEIVFESRISLDSPGPKNSICGVATLTPLDMGASKLLANSDRWADSSVFSRDLIDLAMLDLSSRLLNKAIEKAEAAYGAAVKRDLVKAIDNLKDKPGRLSECMTALRMDSIAEAVLWSKIRKLI